MTDLTNARISELNPEYILIPIAGGVTRIHRSQLSASEYERVLAGEYSVSEGQQGLEEGYKLRLGSDGGGFTETVKDFKIIAILAAVAIIALKVL